MEFDHPGIRRSLKPYLDVERDVMIEELLFSTVKESKETMQNYVTCAVNKCNDMYTALGQDKIQCLNCTQTITRKQSFPETIWSYLLKLGAKPSDERRKLTHSWDTGVAQG